LDFFEQFGKAGIPCVCASPLPYLPYLRIYDLENNVQVSGYRVRVQGSGFRVQVSEFRVQGLEFRV
jgi:hypothetical protein